MACVTSEVTSAQACWSWQHDRHSRNLSSARVNEFGRGPALDGTRAQPVAQFGFRRVVESRLAR